jgi:N-glycosylase/DNA lyase
LELGESQETENGIFTETLREYSRLLKTVSNCKRWEEMTENELWYELVLCILSSNVPYELAQSAFLHLLSGGFLQLRWIIKTPNSKRIIAKELSRPIYLPRKVDGSYRRYRFPNIRAKNIFNAAKVISSDELWLTKLLANSKSEKQARCSLVASISGMGLKEASHFLRNIRYSNELAIIDSHVISFLKEINVVAKRDIRTITPTIYLELEGTLQDICDKYNLNLSIFDMAIWNCMRRE